MSNPQDFSRHNAALSHQRNVDASRRAMLNHQASQSGGGGGGTAGVLLTVGFLVLVVLLVAGVLG